MPKQNVIAVTAKVNGFRRAGRAWSTQTTTVDPAVFSKKQLAALRADPMLHVTDEQVDVADPDATKQAEAAAAKAKADADAKAAGGAKATPAPPAKATKTASKAGTKATR